jgi:hypothetical protein
MSFMEIPLPPTDLAPNGSGIGRYTLRILFAALPSGRRSQVGPLNEEGDGSPGAPFSVAAPE